MIEMNNEVINAIIEKNDAEIAAILEKADEYAHEKRAAATESAKAEAENSARLAAAKAEDIKVKRSTAARMERAKMLLAAKRKAVASVYEKLLAEVKELDGKDFLAVVKAITGKYGEKGQKMILSASAPVTEKQVAELPAVKAKNMTVEKSDALAGGFVLSGETFDLDFTCAAIVESVRERTEKDVADEMFGEKQ